MVERDDFGLYAKARHAMPESLDGQPPLPVPESCEVTLDDLLSGE